MMHPYDSQLYNSLVPAESAEARWDKEWSAERTKLDIGAGMAPLPGYTSVDPYEKADISAPAHAVPLPDASVEAIHCCYMMQSYTRKTAILAFREFYRLLTPEGEATVIVPDGVAAMKSWLAAADRNGRVMDLLYGSPEHSHHATGMAWDKLLLSAHFKAAGFKAVEVREDIWPPHYNDPVLIGRGIK